RRGASCGSPAALAALDAWGAGATPALFGAPQHQVSVLVDPADVARRYEGVGIHLLHHGRPRERSAGRQRIAVVDRRRDEPLAALPVHVAGARRRRATGRGDQPENLELLQATAGLDAQRDDLD